MICAWCDKEFERKQPNQKYCSAECAYAATKMKINDRAEKEKAVRAAKERAKKRGVTLEDLYFAAVKTGETNLSYGYWVARHEAEARANV